MVAKPPEKLEHTTAKLPKKKGKGKARTVKITVEFDQDSIGEALTGLIGEISDLVR